MIKIKEDLIKKSGLALKSARDCKLLSDLILNETSEYLSAQTIRRLLGLVRYTSTPTLVTLDILSRYLGFDSYNSFVLSSTLNLSTDSTNTGLLFISSMYSTPLENFNGKNTHFLFRTVSKTLFENPGLIDDLVDEVLKSPAFKEFFIERFPPIDLLNQNSTNLFSRLQTLYPRSIWFNLFIDSIIYLNAKSSEIERAFLNKYAQFDERIPQGLHPFIIGRFYGVKILFCETEDDFIQIHRTALAHIWHLKDYGFQFCFVFTYLEFLIKKDHFETALSLIDQYFIPDLKIIYWMEYGYKEVMKIFHFVCLVRTGRIKDALDLREFINCDTIPFYFRNTYRRFYETNNEMLLHKIGSN